MAVDKYHPIFAQKMYFAAIFSGKVGPPFAIQRAMKKITLTLITILSTATFAAADVAKLAEQPDGAILYQENCSRCHGKLEETRIPDRRAGRIASAINNLGVMAKMKHLNALQIVAISRVLKSASEKLAAQ